MTTYADIREIFGANQNMESALPMESYMKNHFKFFGIKSPQRKEISRELYNELKSDNSFDILLFRQLWEAPERELQYFAMEYMYRSRKHWQADILDHIIYAITHKSWWDSVDYIASNIMGYYGFLSTDERSHPAENMIYDDNMWLNRTAILMQLKYKEKTDTEFLAKAILAHTDSGEFFLQKAIGWALRQYSKTHPGWVSHFLDTYPLQKLSVREASKYLDR